MSDFAAKLADLYTIDTSTKKQVGQPLALTGSVVGMVIAPNGKYAYLLGYIVSNGVVRVLDVQEQ